MHFISAARISFGQDSRSSTKFLLRVCAQNSHTAGVSCIAFGFVLGACICLYGAFVLICCDAELYPQFATDKFAMSDEHTSHALALLDRLASHSSKPKSSLTIAITARQSERNKSKVRPICREVERHPGTSFSICNEPEKDGKQLDYWQPTSAKSNHDNPFESVSCLLSTDRPDAMCNA